MYIPFLPVSLQPPLSRQTRVNCGYPRIKYFALGRQAMRVGLDVLNIKKNDTVLMPASMCSAVIEPFHDLGVNITRYKLDSSLQFSLDNIIESVTPSTTAIYVIHYFGIKADLSVLQKFCGERDIALIEDCALSGFSADPTVVEFGDICIYSLWKFHALADGAILKIREQIPTISAITYKPKGIFLTLLSSLKIEIKKWIMRGVLSHKYLIMMRGELQDYCLSEESVSDLSPITSINKMSQLSLQRFLGEDLEGVARQRRFNFHELAAYCKSKNIRTLYSELAENDIPYCFPIIVDNAVLVQRKLAESGIESEISVNSPSSFSGLLGNTKKAAHLEQLSRKCLSLPIHQNIDIAMLGYLKSKLSSAITLTSEGANQN